MEMCVCLFLKYYGVGAKKAVKQVTWYGAVHATMQVPPPAGPEIINRYVQYATQAV